MRGEGGVTAGRIYSACKIENEADHCKNPKGHGGNRLSNWPDKRIWQRTPHDKPKVGTLKPKDCSGGSEHWDHTVIIEDDIANRPTGRSDHINPQHPPLAEEFAYDVSKHPKEEQIKQEVLNPCMQKCICEKRS